MLFGLKATSSHLHGGSLACLIKTKSGIFFSNRGKRIWRSTKTRVRAEAYKMFVTAEAAGNVGVVPQRLSLHMQAYVAYVRMQFGARTSEMYKWALNHFMKFSGDIPVTQVTTRLIDQYKIQRLASVASSTVNIELRTFRAFFNCLKRWGLVSENPCDGVSQIKIPERLPVYLDMNELQELLNKITDK